MTRPLRKKALLSLAVTACTLTVAELGLRLYGFHFEQPEIPLVIWNKEEDKLLDEVETLHRADQLSLWTPRAHAAIPWSSGEVVNALGYRGTLLRINPEEPEFRLAFLGDSSTFGWGLDSEKTYASACAQALEAEGIPTESLNAGVVGYSIVQGLARYRELVRRYQPDVVVIAFGAVNDHLHGPGQESDASKISKLDLERDWWGRRIAWARTHLRVAQFVEWMRFRRSGGSQALRLKYKEARKRSLTDLEKVGRPDYPGVRRVSLPEYERYIEELVTQIEADGARAILLSMPRKLAAEEQFPVLVQYSHATEASATRLGVHLVDIRTQFRSYGEVYEKGIFYDYWHPRPKAHSLIAEELLPILLSVAEERGHPR